MIAWLAIAPTGTACQVPVFRYALERWPADPFALTLFLPSAPDPDTAALANALQEAADAGKANILVARADVGGEMGEPEAALWKSQKDPKAPWLVVEYPPEDEVPGAAWSGPFEAGIARQLLDSPARRELATRLARGDSTVWVLLASGDAARDKAAEELLAAELRKLEGEIEVPPVDPEDPRTAGNAELKIAFSILRLDRADPAEKFFIAQLLGIDAALAGEKGPIAFPVFGRGRVLAGFAGDQLAAEPIREATFYVCGACSCEIKAQNPGVDLLMAVDWDTAIENKLIGDPELPPLVSLSALVDAAQPSAEPAPSPTRAAAEAVPPAEEPRATGGSLTRNLLAVGGLALVLLVWGTLRMLGRKGP